MPKALPRTVITVLDSEKKNFPRTLTAPPQNTATKAAMTTGPTKTSFLIFSSFYDNAEACLFLKPLLENLN